MPSDTVFSSKIKYGGVFNFSEFYLFCYDWLSQEVGLKIAENKYQEKLSGDSKDVEVEWKCNKKFDDYFKFEAGVKIKAKGLKKKEIIVEGKKITTNEGSVEVEIKGDLVRDYDNKFNTTPGKQLFRTLYDDWVIKPKKDEMSGKVVGACDGFLTQAKAFLDLEGKK